MTVRGGSKALRDDGPILEPCRWTRHVNWIETRAELKTLRHRLARVTPFGDTYGRRKAAVMPRREFLLRPGGGPGFRGKDRTSSSFNNASIVFIAADTRLNES